MEATLRDSIRIPLGQIPENVRLAIESVLTIKNPQKEVAERELLWNARQIDEHLRLFAYDDSHMILPMGFKSAFMAGCRAMGIPLEITDLRSDGYVLPRTNPIVLRDYQSPMARALIQNEVGVGEAPTAAGKTATTLAAIQQVGRSALIIVEKTSLAEQWMSAIEKLYGVRGMMFVKGDWGPLTVALRQSLHAADLDEYFFNYFGTIVVDEAHHASTAWTLIALLQRFTARRRWGVTATPDRDKDYFPVLQAVLGPVVWETTIEDAKEHLVIPSVKVLESDFEFDFKPTRRYVDANGRNRQERNNYGDMIATLCDDHDRNALISSAALREARAGHHVLIVSDRTGHLRSIHDELERVGDVPIYVLTSKLGDFGEIKHAIESATTGSILLSTVAEEGLSIDRLDRVIPAYPRSNPETMRQIAGRVMRPWPGKTDAVIIDVRDGKQFLLKSQFQGRAQRLYGKEGWHVER